jgi:hypothetical protein
MERSSIDAFLPERISNHIARLLGSAVHDARDLASRFLGDLCATPKLASVQILDKSRHFLNLGVE